MLALLAAAVGLSAQAAGGGDPVSDPAAAWREAPEYVSIFAPRAHQSGHRAFVSPHPIDDLVRRLGADARLLHPPGAWTPEPLGPGDAFGDSGPYNRMTLAMLYRGQPVRVARGPRSDGHRVVETWTMFSPYPSPGFDRLMPGTLLLVARTATP